MLQYLVRRLLWFIPVFFLVTGITFVTMHALPGGPFDSDKTPPALVQQMEATFGLNRPIYVQYAIWLGNVAQLKFGPSLVSRGKTVESFLLPGLAVSAQLGVMALLFALATGMPAGIIAALRRGKWQDRAAMGASILGVSVPAIVLGPVLYWLFGLHLGWLPVAKWVSLDQGFWPYISHAILPAVTLGAGLAAIVARLTRASLLQVLHEDYIRTAHAKGLTRQSVIIRHALRNALIPVVTILGPLSAVADRFAHCRADFCHPRHGPLFRLQHQQPRLPHGDGGRGYLLVNHRVLQPDRRYSLCLHRPPSQTVNLKPWNQSRDRRRLPAQIWNWQRASRERSGRMRRAACAETR